MISSKFTLDRRSLHNRWLMFIKMADGEIFRELIKGSAGSWLIRYDSRDYPIYVNEDEIRSAERVAAPAEFRNAGDKAETKAFRERIELIKPLLDDDRCITDKELRVKTMKEIASDNGTTFERVKRLYLMYLSTGTVVRSKSRPYHVVPLYDEAIKKYYFSAKRNSLRTAYELMLLDYYTDQDGTLTEDAPTFLSFSHYFYRYWSKEPQKVISREGITNYKRNTRMIYKSAMNFREKIGSYQIDETISDIHLVSSYDRKTPMGRPSIYLAIDTVTQMIAGVYIGFERGESGIMGCIVNCMSDKKEYCRGLGIEIDEEDWPCTGMPNEIIADRGKEFSGKRMEDLCLSYGVMIMNQPPFRADLKPFVERMMGLIQDSYKSMLRGKGGIEDDAAERWAMDYRDQAVLTLEEYRKIVITCILTINKSRVIDSLGHLPIGAPNTALGLWKWFMEQGKAELLDVDAEEVYVRSLPREVAKVTRVGITVHQLRYIPSMDERLTVGDTVTYAYDVENVRHIYVFRPDGSYMTCSLSDSSYRYREYSRNDIRVIKREERTDKNLADRRELEMKVKMRRQIREIVDNATREKEGERCATN